MNIKNKLLITVMFILVLGCKEHQPEMQEWTLTDCSDAFETTQDVTTTTIDLPATIAINGWTADDSLLICETPFNEVGFYRFRLSDFALCDSFAIKGQGPDEWNSPQILSKSPTEDLIIDNGLRKIFITDKIGHAKQSSFPIRTKSTISFPQLYRYPLLGFVEMLPNSLTWKLENIETGETTAAFSFTDEQQQDDATQYQFCWRFHDDRVVLGFYYQNRFGIGTMQDGKLDECVLYQLPKDAYDKEQFYYSDILCLDKAFCLLSQKKFNEETGEGYSEIEIYNYEGEPQKCLTLDFAANFMLLDNSNRRLLFTSNSDEQIHLLSTDCISEYL